MRVPRPAAGRMAAIRLMFGAIPPRCPKAGFANSRVYLKAGPQGEIGSGNRPSRPRVAMQQVILWNDYGMSWEALMRGIN
jgi:hypothetical protein